MVGGVAVFCRRGSLILGRLERAGAAGASSGTPNDMISTMLETSFLMRSGREVGTACPFSFRLQRYIASANSGKRSWPDLVVSDRVLDGLTDDSDESSA